MASVVKPGLGPWKRKAPAATKAAVVLTQQRVYVMPSRMGGVFSLTLFLMLLGSINYNLGLGYVLTFLLGGLGMVSLLHTWRNLAGLDIRPGRPERVFAGDHLRFTVSIRNPTGLARFAIGLRRGHEVAHFVNVGPRGEAESFVEMVAKQRGWLEPGRMEIATNYPLGLFRAWSYMHFEQWALVYPRPEPAPPPLPLATPRSASTAVSPPSPPTPPPRSSTPFTPPTSSRTSPTSAAAATPASKTTPTTAPAAFLMSSSRPAFFAPLSPAVPSPAMAKPALAATSPSG